MAENKQYITQVHENGSVQISEDVIATILTHAVSEVDGVVGLNVKPGADIADLIGKKSWGKGVKIVIDSNDAVTIDCNITVTYGHNVVTVAKTAQTAIANALESMAGIVISAVNVNVCGIVRP